MKISLAKFLTAGISFLYVVPALAAATPEDEARNSAKQWLALTDAGKSAESRQTAAGYPRAAAAPSRWPAAGPARRTPAGAHRGLPRASSTC